MNYNVLEGLRYLGGEFYEEFSDSCNAFPETKTAVRKPRDWVHITPPFSTTR